ncbi:Ig-like domain-containing protein, partial [Thauera aromatica]|uniref:Ig-like domain-containing protein n=1 Tax=Thauera aromatica TaxID=59405 RepID=UPI001FFC88C7
SGGTLSGFTGSGTSYSATFTPTADSSTGASISVASDQFSDAAGNANADGTDTDNAVTMTVDTVRPTIAVTSDKTALKAGETATISFTLSEAVTDFTADDVTVSGGALSGFTGSGTSYSATFTPTADSSTGASISVASDQFSDAAGNANADGADTDNAVTMTVDTVRPTIAVTSDKTALKAGETATITFTLSESATDFTAGD